MTFGEGGRVFERADDMADVTTENEQKKSASVPDWRRELYESTALVGPAGPLMMTHTGQVMQDGIWRGVGSLVATTLGVPRDLFEFGRERFTGFKRAVPEKDLPGTSEWFEDRFNRFTDSSNTYWTGKKGPEIRPGTPDRFVHGAAELAPLVGSIFVPGLGQTQLAARMGTAGKVIGSAGIQLGAVELGTLGVKGGEWVAGVERPVESPNFAYARSGKIKTVPGLISSAQASDLGSVAERMAATSPAGQYVSSVKPPFALKDRSIVDAEIIAKTFSPAYLSDPKVPGAFAVERVKALQQALMASGHLKSAEGSNIKADDGVFGPRTAVALDASLRQLLKPMNVTPEEKLAYEQQVRQLASDLRTSPAAPYAHDPRVVALQASAYALGWYDGKIDGLFGPKTDAAISRLEPKPDLVKVATKGPEPGPG